jgi:membrane protease YdiL (CAAX protease family)
MAAIEGDSGVIVPDGARYDHLARTPAHRWWRPIVGTVLVLLLWVVGMMAVFGIGSALKRLPGADTPFTGGLLDTASGLASIATAIPAVMLGARFSQLRPAGTVSSVLGRVRWRWLAICAAASIPVTGVMIGLLLLLDAWFSSPGDSSVAPSHWAGAGPFAIAVVVLLVLVPLQAAGEEYLARGWFIQALGSWFRNPIPGMLVGGMFFVALHSISQAWGAADLLLFALTLGFLAVLTGGLEAGVALHAVGNLVGFILQALSGTFDQTSSAGDAPWQQLAADGVMLPLYALAVVWLHRRTGQARFGG